MLPHRRPELKCDGESGLGGCVEYPDTAVLAEVLDPLRDQLGHLM